MKKLSLVALLAVGLLAVGTSDAVACKNCGCSKKKADAACAKKGTCPLAAALKAAKLSKEQQKKVDALMAECKAACQKAGKSCCPDTKASLRTKAMKTLQTKLAAILTADQKTIVEPAFAKMGKKAGAGAKTGGCGK